MTIDSTFIVRAICAVVIVYISYTYWIHIGSPEQEKKRPFPPDAAPEGWDIHTGYLIRLKSRVTSEGIKIQWEFKKNLRNKGYYILGYRKEGERSGFGDWHIRSFDNGSTCDLVTAGITYVYIFIVWKETFCLIPKMFNDRTQYETVEFRIKILSPQERIEQIEHELKIRELQARLDNTSVKQDPIDAKLERIRTEFRSFLKSHEEIDSMEKEFTDKIEAGPYSQADKNEKLSRLKSLILDMRDKI